MLAEYWQTGNRSKYISRLTSTTNCKHSA